MVVPIESYVVKYSLMDMANHEVVSSCHNFANSQGFQIAAKGWGSGNARTNLEME